MDPEQLSGYSNSPAKPRLLMEYLERKNLLEYFQVDDNFPPMQKEDFYIAHTAELVDNFFDIGKTTKILRIKWTPEYAESVTYANASLYHAIRYAVIHPDEVCFSPSCGFHHANPTRSALFCAFSGQVIASMKVYYEFGFCGAYIDLDGHYGNSIDNSRDFVKDIDKAISPVCGNINIMSRHEAYIEELKYNLGILRKEIIEGRVHYVVFCHGADSHEWDELASQLSTEEWVECSVLVYTFIRDLQTEIKKQIPLILSLFGGYRKDDYNSVLSLHTTDLVTCLNILCGRQIDYKTEVLVR
jgi:acetoin utilization deacetylase AcuC-like enzyme